jgi:nucleoid DNA-binding protein
MDNTNFGALAFVKGTVSTRTRPGSSMIPSSSTTMRMAVAKKGTAKKVAKKAAAVEAPATPTAAAKKDKEPKDAVENFRKSEFVASIAEKTGMTKVDSETALNAVLDTLSDVSTIVFTKVFVSLILLCILSGLVLCVCVCVGATTTKVALVSFQVVCLDSSTIYLVLNRPLAPYVPLFRDDFCSSHSFRWFLVFDVVVTLQQVVAGKRVSLVGFGTFQLRARAARKGRNPQTGEEIEIKASKSPGFSPAKAFKDKANL